MSSRKIQRAAARRNAERKAARQAGRGRCNRWRGARSRPIRSSGGLHGLEQRRRRRRHPPPGGDRCERRLTPGPHPLRPGGHRHDHADHRRAGDRAGGGHRRTGREQPDGQRQRRLADLLREPRSRSGCDDLRSARNRRLRQRRRGNRVRRRAEQADAHPHGRHGKQHQRAWWGRRWRARLLADREFDDLGKHVGWWRGWSCACTGASSGSRIRRSPAIPGTTSVVASPRSSAP